MKHGEILVIAIDPKAGGIHAYGGFDTQDDAIDFVAADLIPVQYTQIAVLPVQIVRPLDTDASDVVQ